MRTPGASRDPPLMMSREGALLADKAKRGLLCHPGKPCGSVGHQREQAPFGTEHDVVALPHILDARDDVRRRAGPWLWRGQGPTSLGRGSRTLLPRSGWLLARGHRNGRPQERLDQGCELVQ